ncbi:MAG: UDP-3-O-(3-hydroxymyristoyl)glucosamine N-acyltransferase [Halioglobus sp.]
MTHLTLEKLAHITGGELRGDGSRIIHAIASMHNAKQGDITFLSDNKYKKDLGQCQGSAIMVRSSEANLCTIDTLIVDDPYVAYAKVAQVFDSSPKPIIAIAPTAVIDSNAIIGLDVAIGPNAVIEAGVILEEGATIGAGCFVGKNTRIGKHTRLWPNVTVYHNVSIGESCIIHSNSVIGSDGFGNANEKGEWIKIPQLGSVKMGNRVEIGSCTTIDRGAIEDTIIEDNVVIDNQVQIAHNVKIGYGSAIAGAAGVAGSTTIGKYCLIGGASVINGHITIADEVMITGMAMVNRSIPEKGVYSSGIPLQSNREWRKTAARVMKIDELFKEVKAIKKKLIEMAPEI